MRIERKHIIDFFDIEAECAKKSYDALMKLPVKERLRKRKAIDGLRIDKNFAEVGNDGESRYKLFYKVNLSDFKEGENLLLHTTKGGDLKIRCTMESTDDADRSIIVSVSRWESYDVPQEWFDEELILDKDLVDLRPNVYNKFIAQLPASENFWKKHILNNIPTPTFDDAENNAAELRETEQSFGLKLTESQREAILGSMNAKDYYMIQGPPGTGKSFVLSLIILEEVFHFGRKVAVIGPNHLAINNTLEQVLKLYPMPMVKIGQRYNAPTLKRSLPDGNEMEIINVERANVLLLNQQKELVVGLTPHSLYTKRAEGFQFDTLVIDEAGQMPIPMAMMGMLKAKKIIFAGDHKQLPPIITSDDMPDDMKSSVFSRLINKSNCTLLDTSFRMCEEICAFVSNLFYDGKLKSVKPVCDTVLASDDPLYEMKHPISFVDVDDEGEQVSDLEAERISDIVSEYLRIGLSPERIAVMAPFRAQVANIKRKLRKVVEPEVMERIAVDTIDKMQGQERDVIILSFTTGNAEYMSEMGEFIYNPNKLNVAFSRAKFKLILVGNMKRLRQISPSYPVVGDILNALNI